MTTVTTAALDSRPGVMRVGALSKEGATAPSRAFPSRRQFVLLEDGRLEYYEEKSIKLGANCGLASSVSLNEWNCCLHVAPQTGIAVGDILLTLNGAQFERSNLSNAPSGPSGSLLTLLRAKGEVPIWGARIEAVGDVRIRITVSKHGGSARPPYVLIASDVATRDEWLNALTAVASKAPEGTEHEVWRSDSRTTLDSGGGSASLSPSAPEDCPDQEYLEAD